VKIKAQEREDLFVFSFSLFIVIRDATYLVLSTEKREQSILRQNNL